MKRDRHTIQFLLCCGMVLFIFTGCTTEKKYEGLTGELIGLVVLYDQDRNIVPDCSNVEVCIEGTKPLITVLTNEKGRFEVKGLETGTYNLSFKKEGYGTHKLIGYQFLGGEVPATVYQTPLFELTNNQVEDLELTNYDNSFSVQLLVKASVHGEGARRYALYRYYLGNTPDVSYKDYLVTSKTYSYEADRLYFPLQVDTLQFPVGTEMYMIIYPVTESSQYYLDSNTGNKIYSTVNDQQPSNVARIVIPEVQNPWMIQPSKQN